MKEKNRLRKKQLSTLKNLLREEEKRFRAKEKIKCIFTVLGCFSFFLSVIFILKYFVKLPISTSGFINGIILSVGLSILPGIIMISDLPLRRQFKGD